MSKHNAAPRTPALEIDGLTVGYSVSGDVRPAVWDVSLQVRPGESYGLVGESGCGKSTVAFAVMRYLPPNARVLAGDIRVEGRTVPAPASRDCDGFRDAGVAMVYQEPASALNPAMRVGDQLAEVYQYHDGLPRNDARAAAELMLERVRLPDARRLMRRYPHQLSGGQQQRVVIAEALAASPRVLILDEPTTGLDTTVQAEVLGLIRDLRDELDTAMVFISHDLGLVSEMCDRLAVLYAGRVVEEGSAAQVFESPSHPYTLGLLRCIPESRSSKRIQPLAPIPGSLPRLGEGLPGCYFAPRCAAAREVCEREEPPLAHLALGHSSRCLFAADILKLPAERPAPVTSAQDSAATQQPLLQVRDLVKRYGHTTACNHVTLEVRHGEVLGLVGESGSGKTTLARCIAGLARPDEGSIVLDGRVLPPSLTRRSLADLQAIQVVFQSPETTLNPSHSVRHVLVRALKRLGGNGTVEDLADSTSIGLRQLEQRTAQLSGGQKQRVAIARALAGAPRLVICDEPVSALDVSVQAGILNLLNSLQRSREVACLFISHDLGVVRYISDRVAVMYHGDLCEIGAGEEVFGVPHHPYTDALLSAIPSVHRQNAGRRPARRAAASAAGAAPGGCRFSPFCPWAADRCATEPPPWRSLGEDHAIRCHLEIDELRRLQEPAQLDVPPS